MTTCVLFGAGAELDFNLCNGVDFARIVIGLEKTEIYKNAILEFYKGIDDRDAWFPNCSKFKYKVEQEKLFKSSYRKHLLDDYYEIGTKREFNGEVDKKWKSLLDENNNLRQEEQSYVRKIINDNTSYMQILDEKFHTMIAPRVLGQDKFWYVINCYWRAYLCLVESMVNGLSYLEIMKSPNLKYKKMVQFANDKLNDQGEDKLNDNVKNENHRRETYYSVLKEYIETISDEDKHKVNIITTNYTPLCEVICGLNEEQISYVNGSFKWFERPKQMDVFDVTADSGMGEIENHDYFPFIFLQSGVKPIIHPIQIKEFGKCLNFLEKSDRLIIVGYKVNSDDNHLNSIIRNYMKHGKTVIYMSYEGSDTRETLLRKKFRMDDKIDCLKVIDINGENCYSRFRNVLFKDT